MKHRILFSKSVLLFTVALVVVAGLIFAWLYVEYGKIKEENASASPDETIGLYTKDEARALGQLESYFVTGGDEASFISSIESACGGLSLACAIKTLEEQPQGSATSSIKLLRIVLSSSGTFENNMMLLNAFEHSSYPIEISTLSLLKSDVGWDGLSDISLPVLFKK